MTSITLFNCQLEVVCITCVSFYLLCYVTHHWKGMAKNILLFYILHWDWCEDDWVKGQCPSGSIRLPILLIGSPTAVWVESEIEHHCWIFLFFNRLTKGETSKDKQASIDSSIVFIHHLPCNIDASQVRSQRGQDYLPPCHRYVVLSLLNIALVLMYSSSRWWIGCFFRFG